jgi:hypothetical protein
MRAPATEHRPAATRSRPRSTTARLRSPTPWNLPPFPWSEPLEIGVEGDAKVGTEADAEAIVGLGR